MRDGDTAPGPDVLIFGPFTLDTVRSELLRDGKALVLRRQSYDVLRHLAQSPGRVVSNNELVDAVWATRPAHAQDSVTQCIRDIRRAMGEDARWMIRTVSGKGYEFKAPVRHAQSDDASDGRGDAPIPGLSEIRSEAAADPTSAKLSPASAPSPTRWSALIDFRKMRTPALAAAVALIVAVACLGYLSSKTRNQSALAMMAVPTLTVEPLNVVGAEHSAHAARLGEQITQQLSRSPGGFALSVRAASSPAGAAPLAPTRYTLRGVVAGTPTGREVVVHLVEMPSSRQIWSNRLATLDDTDLRAVASQIARTAAVHIRLEESRRPLPARPEASHYALLGRVLLESERGPEMNGRAMAAFDKAIALDRRHFYGLLGFARTRVAAAANGWATPEASAAFLDAAQRAVDTAIEVNPRGVGAHILRGVIERIKGNSERSLASLEYARELNPEYPLVYAEIGRAKIDLGRSQEARLDIARALQLNPTDDVGSIWCYWAGIAAAHLGDDPSAIEWMTKALQRNGAYKEPLPWLAIAHAQRGDQDKAKAFISEYQLTNPGFSAAAWLRLHPSSNMEVRQQRLRFAKTLESLSDL